MPEPDARSYLEHNREVWTGFAAEYAEKAERAWAREEITWGIWGVPDADLGGVLGDVRGLDVVDLGCGTGYFSAALARRGARPVGIDLTPAQLATARRKQREYRLTFPLIEGNAERVPVRDGSFDLALSEYGASIWCDPYLWVPEAARLLRRGGRLVFLRNSTLLMVCIPDEGPAGDRLVRDVFGMHRLHWDDTDETEFHLPHGEWVRLLRRNGFEILDLIEIQAPEGDGSDDQYVTREWARRWPSEEIWVARKRA
jgi:SAM-dependent methyltransferase